MPTILFIPSGKRLAVDAGTLLSDACRAAGFALPAPCGGKGVCGKCRVQILQGDVPVTQSQMACVTASLLVSGWRAACVTPVSGDLVVAEPSERVGDTATLTQFQGRQPGLGSGLWHCDLVLDPPRRGDAAPDAERLLRALKIRGATDGRRSIAHDGLRVSLLAELPRILRAHNFRCRAVGMGRHVLAVRKTPEADGDAAPALGLAVDLGTTTMAAALCDLETGEIFSVAGAANPQSAWGDDVMSRIEYAGRGRAHRDELRLGVMEKIAFLADETKRRAKMDGDILAVSVAGNTVMTHLLLGVDAAALALSPFVPAFNSPVAAWGGEIGWPGGGAEPLFLVMPGIGPYVGGDITAGLLAHDILESGRPALFLDIGTNGEMVLCADGKAYACATAAGPAFEGARIGQGMRAAAGAVSRVEWEDGAFRCDVIGGGAARGICGTGILDAVAAFLAAGIVDPSGRMLDAEEAAEAGCAPGAVAALRAGTGENKSGSPTGVELTQRDVREVQLAKGAVAAGVLVLLGKAGLRAEDVESVHLAGGFGNFLRPASAMAIGLLPAGVRAETIKAVGNAALAGARLYLHSREEREAAESICARVEYVELSGRADFEAAFAEEMLFPDGETED